MRITDALLGEHGAFGPLFTHLEQVVPAATSAARVCALGEMLAATLATHAHLEDELLFAALEPHMSASVGPLAVMRMEHEHIEGSLQRLAEAADLVEAQRLLMQAVVTAQDHFAKEENILFPLAAQVLGAQALEELGGRWAQQRGVVVAAFPACVG